MVSYDRVPTDKELKKEFGLKVSKDPDKYYATSVLKDNGFSRKRCKKCGRFFWTVNSEQDVCGDPSCSGGFRFIGNSPAKHKYDFIQTWQAFSKLFEKLGYTPIERYPVVSRWRDDAFWVAASIYDFQPWVVSGAIKPPANPLVVPQFCLRFNDVDNVGITGAHYTCFVMIGQHAFMPPEKWNQARYFSDIYTWLKEGLGLKNEEISFHEDVWAGGGNFGPCMEFFSRGLELGNQVYMMYELTPSGPKELKLKVLDMGMGQERNAWFSQGLSTSYETTFPSVCERLYRIAGIKVDKELMKKFLPYSSYLNVGEVKDIDKAWKDIASKIKVDEKELREKISRLAALYSIGEHTRAALFAINDGALPSNVGGGYNLRAILRRAFSFIDKYGWDISLPDVAKWHAEYLKKQCPELMQNLNDVAEILEHEKKKFKETKQRARTIVERVIKKGVIKPETLLELYDSQGISPETVMEEAKALNIAVKMPDDFYALLSKRHEQKEQATATLKEEKLDLAGVKDTEGLYFGDWKLTEFDAKIIKIIGNAIVLDKTAFYPTSGGQLHDIGTLNGSEVIDVFKQGGIIVHKVKGHNFKEGQNVHGKIDFERRKQLAQHHTATHIINGAAREVLGNHVWQAGAAKYLDKARLDITHYEPLSNDEIKKIENIANQIIKKNIHVHKEFMQRDEAERRYGFRLYQGGAVPGKEIRVVSIEGFDTEACGGTHLNTTAEVGRIKILKTAKIQDGVIRIEFASGNAAEMIEKTTMEVLERIAKLLGCNLKQIPGRAEELFEKWKEIVKKGKRIEFKLESTKEFEGDVLEKTASILKTQPENVIKVIERFLKEIKETK